MLIRQTVAQALQSLWYGQTWGARWGSAVLYPLSLLFLVLSKWRRRQQSRQQSAFDIPVIVVGNVSVGGTGKTPLSIYLSNCLLEAGYQPGIVSRGYGGQFSQSHKNGVMLVEPDSDPVLAGDEALLMAQRTQRPVVIGRKRNQSIQLLRDVCGCDVVLADDGLQHYRMARDIEIAVLDGQSGLGNGCLLPAGPLREPEERLQECHFVIVNNKHPQSQATQYSNEYPLYTMHMVGDCLHSLYDERAQAVSELVGQRVNVVTALGNPQRFLNALQRAGLLVQPTLFPDHHLFQEHEVVFNNAYPVLMTEKDAVKCRRFSVLTREKLWYLPVSAHLDSDFAGNFLQAVQQIVNRKKHEQTAT